MNNSHNNSFSQAEHLARLTELTAGQLVQFGVPDLQAITPGIKVSAMSISTENRTSHRQVHGDSSSTWNPHQKIHVAIKEIESDEVEEMLEQGGREVAEMFKINPRPLIYTSKSGETKIKKPFRWENFRDFFRLRRKSKEVGKGGMVLESIEEVLGSDLEVDDQDEKDVKNFL